MLPVLLLINCFSLFSQTLETDDDDGYFFEEEAGITVTGTVEISQQVKMVEREQIERSGASDLATLLEETLDLGLTRYGAYGNEVNINLRGFDSRRVAFLVDGAPVNVSNDGKFDINQIGLDSIERVEVIYGGSDSKYNVSGALGGVINIVTVKKQQQGLRFGGSVSNTSTLPGKYRDRSGATADAHWEDLLDTQNYTLSAAYGGKQFSFSAGAFANRAANHFLFKDYLNYIRRKDNNEVWDTGASASLVWDLPQSAAIISSSNFYYGDKNIPTSGFSSIFGNQTDTSFRQNLMLNAPHAFHENLSTEASVTYTLGRRFYEPPAGESSRHDQQGLAVINRWNWFALDWLTLRGGVDYRFHFLDSTDMGIRTRHDGGIYATAEYKPFNSLLIIPSVKGVSDGYSFVPVPKIGFLWIVNNSVKIKSNYFRSFKFPDFEELYWGAGGGEGNPDLRPEDGWGGDVGVDWKWKNLLRLESTIFAQWTNDSIHWSQGAGGAWRPENVGEAVFFGLDSKIGFEIPVSLGAIKKIVPAVSYQYLLSYLLCYGYSWESEKRIPYMPAHTIGGSLEIPWKTGSFLVSCHYESLRYANTANLTELPPVFLLNASVNQKIGKHFSVYGVLRNILNTSYESFADYPMPGITLTLGMRIAVDANNMNKGK